MQFTNRIALITGAGGYIGYELCKEFGAAGVRIAATDISLERVQKTAKDMQALGYDVRAYEQDLTSPQSVSESLKAILNDFGKIDILVNNAGTWVTTDGRCRRRMETIEEEEWLRIIDINLIGTYRMIHEVIPSMVKNGYGRIINMSSISAVKGIGGMAAYSTAKAGVTMLTQCVAMENGQNGITCNSISPGMISRGVKPCKGTWLGVNGEATDVARAALFLADDQSSYITGIDVPVDGGRTLGCHGETQDDIVR